MKQGLLLIITILICTAGFVHAKQDEIGVTLDLTYLSRWLSKGVQAYGQQGAIFKTIDLDFYGTGLGLKVTHRNATSSGYVDMQRFDYRPYYKSQFFPGEPYATNYNISVGYEHYPGLARDRAGTTFEWIFAFAWPNILPSGFTPSYIVHYEYPAGSNYANANVTGWVYRFLLGYDLSVPEFHAPLHLSSEVGYYDGLGNKTHDWGYATFGLSTKFKIDENLSFVPGFYQQITMDESVSKRDSISYVKLSMKYKF